MERILRASAAALLAALAAAPAAVAAPAAYAPDTVIVKYADRASASQRSLAGRLAGVLETPRFGEEWGLHNTGQSGGTADADIDAPEGWDAAFGPGAFPAALGGAKIGIVDTGIAAGHEDLAGKVADCARIRSFGLILGLLADPTVVSGSCADDNGHGTHVAGTAAARTNNGRGIAGVAFDSPLAICKALDALGAGPVAGVANCVTYLASTGAGVISLSLGGPGSTALRSAVAAASQGALIVAAAGNSGNGSVTYPAGYPEVVSVAAVDRNGARASFSNYNADVEIAAPGVDVLSSWRDGGYRALSGTSMATPHAAGVAAIIAARVAGGPAAWRQKLDAAVDGSGARTPQLGFGRVNLLEAVS